MNVNKRHKPEPRVLVVFFDALRPDMVTDETMPNLSEFARRGVRFKRSRSVFPTETRVNQSSFVTGCWPARHNIVGNKFIDPVAAPGVLLNTGDEDALRVADERLSVSGQLLGERSLGELLHAAGRSLSVISAGTPGGGRILHHRAEQTDGMRLALARPDAAWPGDVVAAIEARIGPIPKASVPSFDWLTWTVSAWIEYVEPVKRPAVSVLWLCEPDNSYHATGIGSPDNLRALAHADKEFGRLLDACRKLDEPINIVTGSDHGQLTVIGDRLQLDELAVDAGFTVGPVPGGDAELGIAIDNGGGIYVRDRDEQLIQRVVTWLESAPWCQMVSTREGIQGTLRHSDIGFDSVRAPDVGLCLASDSAPGPWGTPGTSLHDASYPVGGGIHGGLNPIELANWLAMDGPVFVSGKTMNHTVGIVDIMPTLMAILGLDVPKVDGRVLWEALDKNATIPRDEIEEITFGAARTDRPGDAPRLRLSRVRGQRYVHGVYT